MRFLVDESLPAQVVRVLREPDHEVTYVRDTDLRGQPDEVLINYCNEQDLLMITQDVGIQARQLETGLVLLRVERLQSKEIAARVKEVIGAGQETTFLGAATVIERTRVRTRQIPES